MKLSDQEQRILDGAEGIVRQKALELIVRYGDVLGAEKLCTVTWADLFCGAHAYLNVVASRDFDEVFSKMSLCSSETVTLDAMDAGCVCYSGVEADCTEVPEKMLMASGQKEQNIRILSCFVDAGVILSGNCIPYLTGFVPRMGEHFVSCESSAVLFMNSVWGACGNGDGIEASFCAAVCGRTPLWGNHHPDNRGGTDVIEIHSEPASIHDWDILGHAIGRKLPPRSIPILTGPFLRPNAIQLKAFFAALACAAGTEMCHIVGITPEAPTLETAVATRMSPNHITITTSDVDASIHALNGHHREHIDYISLGCPHYHIDEIRRIAEFLEGKRVHSETIVHIWTAGSIKYMADRCGYTDIIERAGATLLTGSCPSSRGYPPDVRTAAYDSAKQRMSAAQETKATLFYGSQQECLESAISGVWEGRT
jgi:predicted aconitase